MVKHIRKAVQFVTAIATNSNFGGFLTGKLYRGQLKSVCVPGLNCYSCPGARFACPIGSFQSLMGSPDIRFSFYVIGFLMLVSVGVGRLVCGFLCPFGLIQEIIHKIPTPKIRRRRIFKSLSYFKYVIGLVMVLLIPAITMELTGIANPAFCKYLCPTGTLEAGIPLVVLNENLLRTIGFLYWWKIGVLIAVLIAMVFIFRPFCRFLCPLGAFYAMFNRYAVFGLKLERDKCTNCNLCVTACKMELNPVKELHTRECIVCGDCAAKCPHKAIKFGSRLNQSETNQAKLIRR